MRRDEYPRRMLAVIPIQNSRLDHRVHANAVRRRSQALPFLGEYLRVDDVRRILRDDVSIVGRRIHLLRRLPPGEFSWQQFLRYSRNLAPVVKGTCTGGESGTDTRTHLRFISAS